GLPLDHPDGPLVTCHRLQPFSAAYFQPGSGLFSYSVEDLQACAAAGGPPARQPFVPGPIPLTADEAAVWSRTDLGRLLSFFANPARFLVRTRLGVRLEDPDAAPTDSEPFIIAGLERFDMGSTLVEHRLKGLPPGDAFAALRAEGRLPHGTMGEVEFRDLWSEVDRFAGRLDALRTAGPLESIDAQWDIAGFSLAVRLAGISKNGCLRYRFGKLRAKDHLDLWLQHLALCLAEPGYDCQESVMVCTDRTLRLKHVADSRSVLEDLLELYRRGLEQPLCFFPKSALEYARARRRPTSEARALGSARTVWEGSDAHRGEGTDPYFRRCFENLDPLGAEFMELSQRVFDPLLDCAENERSA
ncbi:MAG: hypothetical protein ACM3KE_03790, partial [Hyphomicrobiales bacterium]